jgi:hypothetical protein
MILQSGTKFRSFAEQSSFSFNFEATPSSWSGNYSFGVSGDNGALNLFSFKNGKIYDPLNRFVHSYSIGDNINLSGNYSSGAFGYYINSKPIALNLKISEQGYSYREVYVSSPNSSLDFDLNIYGYSLPVYNFSFLGDFPYVTGKSITGVISNSSAQNSSFKVFSGNASFNYTGYNFSNSVSNLSLSAGQSGLFSFDYLGNGTDYTISASTGINPIYYNLTFYTNFGTVVKTGALDLKYQPLYLIDFYQIQTGFNSVTSNYSWFYDLEGKLCDNSPFNFKLEKVSGFDYKNTKTGSLDFTGVATGLVSGFIYGTGFLNGNVSADLKTNQLDYYGSGLSGFPFTGSHSGNLIYKTGFIDATGLLSKDYISGGIFGNGYVLEVSNSQYSSVVQDEKTKKILSGSGLFNNPVLTGITGAKVSGEFYKYYIPGTFFVTNPTLPIIPVSGIFTGSNTGNLIFTGLVKGSGAVYSNSNYSLSFSGTWTGRNPVGQLITESFSSGVNFTNSFVFSTGASTIGKTCSSIYNDYPFSGTGVGLYLDQNNNVISGNYLLRGLSGSFSFVPNTNSGTFYLNSGFYGGLNLPIDTGNLFVYSPAYVKYPEGFSNNWVSGYSIETDMIQVWQDFSPLKYGMGNPLDWTHKQYSWDNPYYFTYYSNLEPGPYIKITFNNDVVAPASGFICDSYCVAPHPQYPSISSWSISGSNDNFNWVLLHSVTGEKLEKNYLKVYDFINSVFYKYLNFKIDSSEDPVYHAPSVSQAEINNNSYIRGFAKFVPLKRTRVTKYLGPIVNSITNQGNNNNVSGSYPSRGYPNEWYRAFDTITNNFFAIIENGNLSSNNPSSRGVFLNKNLNLNTGVSGLNDLSQAVSINAVGFNDSFNFYGGQFSTFMGSARSNFAITNKNNTISSTGPTSFLNPVMNISTTGNRVVVCSNGDTKFLSGASLATLNSNIYTGILFGCADPYINGWRLGSVFTNNFVNRERTSTFTFSLQNNNGSNYILNNGIVFTNPSGVLTTGFPLVRNSGASSPLTWESGVDSDGYSQLRYNLHNEQNGSTNRPVGVSGIITHDLFIPKINQTKKVTYVYGDFTTSKMFRGRGDAGNTDNIAANPQGRHVFAQRMSTGRHTMWNYEFINSGWQGGDAWVRSLQIDNSGRNLIVCTDSTINRIPNKAKLYFLSLPTESGERPIAQDLRNNYNGITDPALTGLTSGGFITKRLPIFNCDGNIYTSLLSGASGLFLGGDFYYSRVNSNLTPSVNYQRAILFNPSGNGQTGVIVTGYGITNNIVYTMALDTNGRVHLGGNFNGATVNSGPARNRYACYDARTAALQSLDFNLNSTVYGIYHHPAQNKLYLGGDFTTLNNGTVTRNRAARINLGAGGLVEDWGAGDGFDGRVRGIKTGFNGDLIFYGNFSRFSGINARFVARFDSNGSFITGGYPVYRNTTELRTDTWSSNAVDCEIDPVDKTIYLIFEGGGQGYGGDMQDGDNQNDSYNYSYRRGLRFDYATLKPSGVPPCFPHGQPLCIKYWNNRMIFGGGTFNHAGFGQFTKGIAAFLDEPTGNLFMDFNPNLNSYVNSACKVNDGLILAGNFTTCDGYAASGLVKVDFFGKRMTGFNPSCQNPNIVKIKNTPSGVFAFSTKPWNSTTRGNFYRIDPNNGSLLKNYSMNLYEASYAGGDFFIDTGVNSIGHAVVGNIKSFNVGSFIEYTFPTPINSLQGYDLILTGNIPSSFSLTASGVSDTVYRTIHTQNTASPNLFYRKYDIDYPLSGIKKVRFDFSPPETGFISVNHINIYEKPSGFMSGLRLVLSDVRGSGVVSFTGSPFSLYTGYDYTVPYYDPSHLAVSSVYEVTGFVPASGFSAGLENGFYKTTGSIGATGTFVVLPSSGSSVINNIKVNSITGSSRASITFKLKQNVNDILRDGFDTISFNTGSFYSSNQGSFTFTYNKSNYQALNSSHFSGIEDLILKINNLHSGWLSGSYNSSSREIIFNAPAALGASGNLMYIKPVISSGINNFFENSSSLSSQSFYFSGGRSDYLNMNTGVSGFHSGIFTGFGITLHKGEYENMFADLNSTPSGLFFSKIFTGFTGIEYSGANSYSNIFYATGLASYDYDVRLTGLASGFNHLNNQSGLVTGIIYQTGRLTTGAVNGVGAWNNIILTGSGSPGKVYTIPSGGSDFAQVSNFWTGVFSGRFNFSSTMTGNYSIITGIPVSISTGTGWIDYDSNFAWNFNIKTGAFSSNSPYSGLSLNYNSGAGVYSGSGIVEKTLCIPFTNSQSKFVKFEINHYNPYNSGNNKMKYTISGLTATGSYLFTGILSE